MTIKELLKELKDKKTYKDFIKENKSTFFCAGFFIFDLETKKDNIQLDFYIKEKKKIAAFEFPFNEVKIFEDKVENIKEQNMEIKIDIENIINISKERINLNKSKLIPNKIIAILRDDLWNITCMDNHLGIARIKLDARNGEEIFFNEGNLMEFTSRKI